MFRRLTSLLLALFILAGIWPVAAPKASADVAADGTVNNLIYADGKFVAVGVGKDFLGRSVGEIWTSEDGLSWESYKTNSLYELYGVAYGNSLYVAVGKSGGIVTSRDGITWTNQYSNTNNYLLDVAYGEGQFVAVGMGGTVLTSNDGISWTPQASGVTNALSGIAYGNGVYVAVGATGMIVTSDDGVSWTNASITSGQLNDVVYGDDGFVAVGYAGSILHSSDGVSWQSYFTPEGLAELKSVTYGEGRYVAVGTKNAAYTSDDGVTWENRQSGASEDFFGVAYGASKFVMTGTNGFSIFGDGNSWTYPVSGTSTDIYTVAYGNGLFVAGGNIGLILTSADGTHWTQLPAVFEAYMDSVYAGRRFVMVGLNGVIKTSVNGTDWTAAASGVKDALYGVEYGNGTFVAVGLGGRVLTSADGINWIVQTSGVTQSLIDISYGEGQFIAIGNGGGMWTSPDGVTWTSRDPFNNLYPTSIAYGNGKFVMTASAGKIATSNDGGVSWSVKQVIPYLYNWKSIEYANDTFVAVGIYGHIYTSNDGLAWRDFRGAKNTEISQWAAATFEDVVYGNGMYVAVGSRGLIAQYSVANLSSLQVTGGVLQPDFTYAKTRYIVNAAHDVSSFTVTATTAVSGAGLQINGVATASGGESAPISLNLGSNDVDVVVTALDGTKQTYKLNVIREVDPPVNVTFDSQGGSTVASVIGVSVGAKLAKPADPTRTNYLFAGWHKDASYATPWSFEIDKVKTAMTLYAKWTALYQVTFDSQGGSTVAGVTGVVDGTAVTKPADPTRAGYYFAGWYTDAGYTTPWSFASDKVNADLTLYARWELIPVITYTLTYDTQGGSAISSETGIISGTTAVQPAEPTRAGYAFEGWYREAELWTFWSFNEKVTDNMTLYARWKVAYTVTFDSQGGSAVANATGIISGGSAPRPLDPMREGYAFVGWSTRSDSFIPFDFATDSIGESLVLYAIWELIPPDTYTVTFDSLGGSLVASLIGIRQGDKIDEPEETTRSGYEFLGWYDADNNKFWDFATDTVNGNVILYGLWKDVTYSVLFDSQGGSIVANAPTIPAGTTVAKPIDPTRAGYAFAGWYSDTSYSTPWNFLADTVNANTTLYAKWTADANALRTVTFDSQGGSAVASETNVIAGTTVPKPSDPTRAGYAFAGWYKEASGTTAWNFATDTVSANLTLYAKWDVAYTVTFDSQEGSAVDIATGVRAGTTVAKPTDPTREGYTFAGWYREAGYATEWNFESDAVNANLTLYAKWETEKYMVAFDKNDGSETTFITDLSWGDKISEPPIPTRLGYIFLGWINMSNGLSWDFETDTVTESTLLLATWVSGVMTYTVTYDSQGGSAVASATGVSAGATITKPADPTRAGYTFTGWYREAGHVTSWRFGTDTVTANTTLYAKWTAIPANTYTVTFDSQGGSDVDSATGVSAGATITKPADPTRAGYTFAGWYREAAHVTPWEFATDTVNGNITLYAKWKVVSSGGGGSAVPDNSEVFSDNGELSLPVGRPGEVSLNGDEITIEIPADAMGENMRLTIETLLDTEELLANDEMLLSQVFEVLKNIPGNFKRSIKLTLAFDPAKLSGDQKASIFYYDEVKKEWVEVGGTISGGFITAEVDHFTKFAVLAVSGASTPEIEFSDIAGHWAAEAIRQGARDGIVTGYSDGTFRPDLKVTRAQFAVMVMNAVAHSGEAAQLNFEDAAQIPAWASNAVAQAVQAGIITGYEDGTFRPNTEITRVEMAVMIAKALGLNGELDSTGFADDESIPSWARGAVAELKALGLMQGAGGNRFDPASNATRAEAVKILTALGNVSK
ncbi:InlB B-repeat-containing protein [Paenibacillus sp. YIM B09110]|uniref:InlB B-repeat-containing protein n=1 Tax=Paenibacillus sp. YIM B09110 TaxID=3126102 RepID=UPI00301D9A70